MNKVKDTKVMYLTYQLIKEKRKNENEIYDSYGILLTGICGEEVVDISVFKDLTSIRQKALLLLRVLSKNQVRPCEVYDFVEDFLA